MVGDAGGDGDFAALVSMAIAVEWNASSTGYLAKIA